MTARAGRFAAVGVAVSLLASLAASPVAAVPGVGAISDPGSDPASDPSDPAAVAAAIAAESAERPASADLVDRLRQRARSGPGARSRAANLTPGATDITQDLTTDITQDLTTDAATDITQDLITDAATDDRAPGSLQPAADLERQATVRQRYTDVCDDAQPGALDLRHADILQNDETDNYLFAVEFCTPMGDADLTPDDVIVWILSNLDTVDDGGDFEIDFFRDDAGALTVSVLDIRGSVAIERYRGPATLSRDGYRLSSDTIPDEVLDSYRDLIFFVASVDERTGGVDLHPDVNEGFLVYPLSCNRTVLARAQVVTRPGAFDTALAAARQAGYRVSVTDPRLGAFEVRGVGDAGRRALADLPGVATVDVPVLYERQAAPNDPEYADQWALRAVQAEQGWDVRSSSGLSIAIIDDGIDAGRDDLTGRVGPGRDTVFDVTIPPGVNSDRGGHGTAVAGVASARGNDGRGIAGVDWGATLLPYRVFDAAGCSTDTAIAAAVSDAAYRGATAINLSLGGPSYSELLATAAAYAERQGSVVAASAGNDGGSSNVVNYPAALPTVISVGASTVDDDVAVYSNTDSETFVVAPGGRGGGGRPQDILVLGERDTFQTVSGTSFSGPMVVGAAALFRAVAPGANPAEFRAALAASATDLGDPGYDPRFGHGRLDLGALLRAAVSFNAAPDTADQLVHVLPGGAVTIELDARDRDGDTLAFEVTGLPRGVIDATRPPTVTYRAPGGFTGDDRLTYTASDGRAGASAVVTFRVGTRVVDRIAGASRFETAAAISAASFQPGVEVAYVATGTDFPDALAGSAAAGAGDGPVLLVARELLPQATRDELVRLRPDAIVVLGGPNAIGPAVAVALDALAGPGGVRRVAGADRYATAAAISTATFAPDTERVYVATGAAFPDALAGAPAAILTGSPLLLVTPDSVPAAVVSELGRLSPRQVVVLGGRNAVSDPVFDQLRGYADDVFRIAGADRFDTAARVAAIIHPDPDRVTEVYLATGTTFPDALAGGVAAGLAGDPVLLVAPTTPLPAAVIRELERSSPGRAVVLGGRNAVSDGIVDLLR